MRKPFQRRERRRQVGRRALIACEGKSERGYFDDLRVLIGLSKERIPVIIAKHPDPLSVVTTAINERADRLDDWDDEDLCWAVFDGDRANDAQANWDAALRKAQEEQVSIAVSNPCFELWYLLHFRDQFAHLSSDEAIRRLRENVPSYEKTSRLFPDPLQPLTKDALRRATQMEHLANQNGYPPHENPCAGAYRLVELLLSLANNQ